MYSHFTEGLISGTFRKLSSTEIKEIVTRNHFGFTPLTLLTETEEQLLFSLALDDLSKQLNCKNLEDLCGKVFYDGKTFYVGGGEKNDPYTKSQPLLLSPDQKIKLFLDPKIWHHNRIGFSKGSSSDLTRYGNRNLLGEYDAYFRTEREFRELLEKLRQRTKVSKLVILDIGCGMGKALQDMKELDSHIETHGITMEPEPAMFNADYFHYMTAERMPLEFEGKFHLIVSNMAFRYFLFQHKALLNVVRALANGGYTKLHFSFDRVDDSPESRAYFLEQVPRTKSNYNAMKVLVAKTMAELENLQKKGEIRITPSANFYQQSMQGGLTIEKINNLIG